MTTKPKRAYQWRIPPERRQELNRQRYETMKAGREAARQARSVNTPIDSKKD